MCLMDQSLLELEMLELDERLTRHWLTWTLPLGKRIELEEHLESIRLKRLELIHSEIASNAALAS